MEGVANNDVFSIEISMYVQEDHINTVRVLITNLFVHEQVADETQPGIPALLEKKFMVIPRFFESCRLTRKDRHH